MVLLLLAVWFFISSGKIRTYTEENSISEKFVMDVNGAPNGLFINGVDQENPVLLLVSSGPGTDDYVFTEKYKDMRLEEDFTVVYWDYRWMGIAYGGNVDKDSITLANLLEDAKSVTDYLKERFGKEKIYIMGFSGGSHIALRAVEQHPEDYYAYISASRIIPLTVRNRSRKNSWSGRFWILCWRTCRCRSAVFSCDVTGTVIRSKILLKPST